MGYYHLDSEMSSYEERDYYESDNYESDNDYYEDSCQCVRCTGYSESEEEQDRLEVFKKLCEFFQLPKVYSNMEIKDFHNTDYISDYEFAEKNKLTKYEIVSLINKFLTSIAEEKTAHMKKIKVMIFFQFICLPSIRTFITTNNKIFDTVSDKFKEFSDNEDKVFGSFISQFNFCV